MPRPIILPAEQWSVVDPTGQDAVMLDPSGASYNPNGAPAFIMADTVLGPALRYGAEVAAHTRVTVLCGMQQQAADLGRPSAFEALIDAAQLYGDDTLGLRSPGANGYTDRMMYALRAGITVFNALDWPADAATLQDLDRMDEMSVVAGARTDVLAGLPHADPEQLLRSAITSNIGTITVANALQWAIVGGACDRLRKQDKGLKMTEQASHLVISLSPSELDITRKFGALGMTADVIKHNMDSWPDDVTNDVFRTTPTMETGIMRVPR